MKDRKDKILNLILPLISVFAVILAWAIASVSINNSFILPSVKETGERFLMLFLEKRFYLAFSLTLLRSVMAFVISFALAFFLAILSGKNSCVKKLIAPIISITRSLPTIAIVLLLLLWTNSNVAPVIVTMLVVFPTTYTHLESAFSSLDKTVAEAGRVDGANEFQVFKKIEIPIALPSIYLAIGSGFSLNFKLMVAAEVISQTANSIGYMLNTSKVYFETAEMLALVCASVLLGVIIEATFNKLSKKSGEWR